MRVRLIAAGTRLPGWINEGVAEYAKRLGRGLKFELIEIPAGRQAARMRAAIAPRDYVVALEVTGRAMTTPELSRWLAARQADGRDLALLIGGPDGLDPGLSAAADFRWSLSPLTWPHGLARVMVTEQLYRAHSLLQGHPYHRA
ncbi:MAG TPA: 23S rRNA (pseudouridine(1915)-N(3))-methyltransferase RlmH [Steroidobacteraceae bacterium]